jgi:hypothetical protein
LRSTFDSCGILHCIRHLVHILRLCTSLLVNTPLPLEVPECTNQRLPEAHDIARPRQYLRFSSLHRPSPLATQQRINNMSAASLDLARWRASEVVLLDIGKSSHLHRCSSPLRHHVFCGENHCTQHPAPADLCDACDHPPVGLAWSGQQAFRAQHTEYKKEFMASGSRCLAALSRALATPAFCPRHCNTPASPHVSAAHPSMPATVTRPSC